MEDIKDTEVIEDRQDGEVVADRYSLPHPYKGMDYVSQKIRLFVANSLIVGRVFSTWMLKEEAEGRIKTIRGRRGGFLGESMEALYDKALEALLKNPPPELASAIEDYLGLKDIVPLNYKFLEEGLLAEKDVDKQISRAIYLYGLELYDPKNKDHEAWHLIQLVNSKKKKSLRDPYPFSGMNKNLAVNRMMLLASGPGTMSKEAGELLRILEPAIIAELGRRTGRRIRYKYSPVLATVTSPMEEASNLFYPAEYGGKGLKKLENPKDFAIEGSYLKIADQEIPARITDIRTSRDIRSIPGDQVYMVRFLYSLARQSREAGMRKPYDLLSVTERELEAGSGMSMRGAWRGKTWIERIGAMAGLVVELEDKGVNVVASFSRYEPSTKEYFVDVSLFDRVDELLEEYHTRAKDGRVLPHHIYAFKSNERVVRDNPNALMMLERIIEGVARKGMDSRRAKNKRVKIQGPDGEITYEPRKEWTYDAKFSFILSDKKLARVRAELDAQPTANAKNTFLHRLTGAMREIVETASDLDLIYRDFKIIIPDVTSKRMDLEIVVKHTGWDPDYKREKI